MRGRSAFYDAPTAAVDVSEHATLPVARRSSEVPPRAFSTGDRIGEGGRFEIQGRLGAGGMGDVFRATDNHLDRTVAIKFMLVDAGLPVERLAGMLKREAKAMAKLSHENIVAIFDIDAHAGVPFLVMELLDGQSLDVMMESSGIPPLRATEIMLQVARGLAHAHANGIVHRDLKPSNVFILRDGRAKILDFGISRVERPMVALLAGESPHTISAVGTPAYMAPEQWRGEAQDARADIWAAGVVLFQLLTGQLPCSIPDLVRRFAAPNRSRSLAPSVRQYVPSLPLEADTLVATALAEDPQGRFQSARDLGDALAELRRALGGRDASHTTSRVERRSLTLLACVLEQEGGLELDDIIAADERFYRACVDAVRGAGGAIGTPIGGRFFCSFGYPIVDETDAQRAVRAAMTIAEAMSSPTGDAAPGFRIGVHTGVVALPPIAAPGGVPAMQGDVPNQALRIAESAPRGGVCASESTLLLTGGLFVSEPHAEPGRGVPRVLRVISEVESESRFDQVFEADLTPFVGRETELAALYEAWEEAKSGAGGVVVVRGEPGIGKSRLVRALRERVVAEQNIRLTCQCWPQSKHSAFRPIIQLVARSMDLRGEDGPAEKLVKIERELDDLGFELAEAVPLFSSLLSVPADDRYPALDLTPERQKAATIEALASMLLRMSLRRPTLFLIEDMHWVDHSTIELLNMLVDLVGPSRVLVALTCRPEFHVPWSGSPHLRTVSLARLPKGAVESMIARASKDRRLPDEVVDRVIATADGVPLFVEELTRMILDSWAPDATNPGTLLSIPGTLQDLLAARLDRLGGVGKEVAQIGSIIGREFDYALVRRVAPLDELSLQAGLEILCDGGILHHVGRPPDSKYVFKHALIHQAAYQSLVKAERQRLHRGVAEVLTSAFEDTAEQQPELVAYHHAEAGNGAGAFEYSEKAGVLATKRGSLVEAVSHYARARDALRSLPETAERDVRELGLLLALGSPLMSVQGYATPEVERTYARARELARKTGSHSDVFPAMQGLWQFYYVRGMLPVARELGTHLLEIADEAGSSTFRLLAHRAIASTAFIQGDYRACREHTEKGFGLYDMAEHGALALRTGHDPGVAHGVYLAWALWILGLPDQALRRVEETIELAERLDHPLSLVYALCYTALIRNHRGEHVEAADLADKALAITVPNKFALWTAWATVQRGWALAGRGDHEAGIPLMEAGIDAWKATGARVGLTFFSAVLADTCALAGRFDRVEAVLADAHPLIAANDEHVYEAELRRLEGELTLSRCGDGRPSSDEAAAAAHHYEAGIELARKLGGRSWELRLVTSRARLLGAMGRREVAAAGLRECLQQFTEGHDTHDLVAARELLEGLALLSM